MSSSLVLSHVSFRWPDGTPLFTDLSLRIGAGRTGLVAPNGAGKSTLLKLIVGEYTPSGGSVSVNGVCGYLPQNLPLEKELTVAEALGIAPVLDALAAVESGDADERHFTTIGNDWDIEERTRAHLDRLGLGELAFDRRLGTLSGGQVSFVGLTAQLLKRPDVLLLDEPTNNLDLHARRRLYDAIESWNGCLVVVSHDRELLDLMQRIAELDGDELRFFGGNFTAYDSAVRAERELAERTLRQAELEVKREKRDRQLARERAARRASTGARHGREAGLPKIVAGALKRRAQESAGKADDTHSARVRQAQERLDEADRNLRDEQKITVDLPETTVPSGRTLFEGRHLQVHHDGRALFDGDGLTLSIRGPERIALTGANGSGKSTLLRMISGELQPDGVLSRVADGRVAYLSQRLDLLDLSRNVADNLAEAAPTMSRTRRRHLLAQYLFGEHHLTLPVGELSGGERLRATLVCVLHAEPAPHLLLLDEPTNNLDLVSVGQLESALNAYQGAFVVVSHDRRFLTEVGIDRWLRLAEGRLSEADPLDD
ncbi:ABC-F family ATP-binding cassette domain-containing protein [Saccharomonospora xinjiangensis]|uniref:ABC-F family ATP-binding cassette domain-containing protein n=1 Tax=Saccharomonospora xinjiangensis TaxID=75294 RepID=UPI00350FF4DB